MILFSRAELYISLPMRSKTWGFRNYVECMMLPRKLILKEQGVLIDEKNSAEIDKEEETDGNRKEGFMEQKKKILGKFSKHPRSRNWPFRKNQGRKLNSWAHGRMGAENGRKCQIQEKLEKASLLCVDMWDCTLLVCKC